MEQTKEPETNTPETMQSSLGEVMSKLLESMDPQGLLNMADTEEAATDTAADNGNDITTGGNAHAGAHNVSPSHADSNESGTGSTHGDESAEPGEDNNKMEVEPPGFRIVDIEAPIGIMPIPIVQSGNGTASSVLVPPIAPAAHQSRFDFAIPAVPIASGSKVNPITGKFIFQSDGNTDPPASFNRSNPAILDPKPLHASTASNPESRKIPSGVKNPSEKITLPQKKSDPTEPDAIPSKTYEAILENKKKKEKAGTIGGIASGQGPTSCGSFFNKSDNRVLRSVYKEDVSSLSVSSMSLNPVTWKCSVCPSSHSVFEANEKGGRCVIVLADQNFPAVLPSSENRCLSIIRLEHGSLDDLIDLFVNITCQVTVPPGTVILFGSLTSLSRVGLQSYASACINGRRHISGVAKKCEVIPFIPPPLGGCNDPELIRNIVDSCVWLGSIQGYFLSGTAKVLVDLVMDDVEGGEGGPKHLDRPVFLPHSLDSYDGSHVTSPGRPGIPAFVPSWSQADEKKYLNGLIKDLNENLLAGLDPNPNLSRSKVKP
jgi:hypothetical protein